MKDLMAYPDKHLLSWNKRADYKITICSVQDNPLFHNARAYLFYILPGENIIIVLALLFCALGAKAVRKSL